MRYAVLAGLVVAGMVTSGSSATAQTSGVDRAAEQAILEDIRVLAADSLGGRFTGSQGGDRAARYLARRLGEVGARPGAAGWLQEFAIAPDLAGLRDLPPERRPTRAANVVALIRGRDPALRDEVVVIGAHYDHLGLGENRSSTLGQSGEIHNGADDNASGSVALIEIARRLVQSPPKRSVVLVAFSGEELGLLGSAAYVKEPVVPLDRTVAMVNLDMVGRLRNDRLLAFGSETATELPGLLDSLNAGPKFDLKYSGDGFGRSDQQSFYLARKPVIHLFTDLHEDYHRPSDDWDKIIAGGIVRVAAFAAELARAIADRPTPLSFVFKAPPPPPPHVAGPAAAGYGTYLGSIPDMSTGGPGVRLSGVRPESPAAKGGLTEGDVLLSIGTFEIADLQAMTDALRSHQPGDTVMIRFRRAGAVDSTRVVLGRRGG
jgi:hypothetical protein